MAARTAQPIRPRSQAGILTRLILIVLIVSVIRTLPGGWGHGHDNTYMQLGGLGLFLIGLASAVWARIYLAGNWSFPRGKRQDSVLITTGPYRFVRHPIYSGILLAMLGTAIALTWYWLVVTVVFGAYFIPSAIAEERYMSGRFAKDYPAYIAKSKMFIPSIF